jgi:hypothetical protein
MVAEGAKGMKLRERAWEVEYGDPGDIRWLPEPIQAANPLGWNVFIEACRRLRATLIVLDTQARITVGLNENDATAMGVLVDAVRRLRAATGACVLVVHHTGRNGGDARGSSALDGAQDTEIRVERPSKRSMTARVTTDKQKDGDDRFELELRLKVHDFGLDERGRKLASLAVEAPDVFNVPVGRPEPEWFANLTDNQGRILQAMRDHSGDQGATEAMILKWLKERGPSMPRTSCSTALRSLVAKDLLEAYGVSRYRLPEGD